VHEGTKAVSFLILRTKTWTEARTLAYDLANWVFRGQEDAAWMLNTTLQRGGKQAHGTSFLLSKLEEQVIEEFQRRAHLFLPDPPPLTDLIEWMALIQHFGGPTRLLDFTSSFYVAAFFALEKAPSECAVWCVNDYALYKAVGPLLGLDMERLPIPYWQVPHRMALVAQNIIRQKAMQHRPFVFEAQPFRLNQRLASQQGLFLCPLSVDIPFMPSLAATFNLPDSVFSSAQAEDYDVRTHTKQALQERVVIKVLLPLSIHHDALQDLWNMNVSAATLFPGLDGFARSMHYFLRIDNLWDIKFQSEYRSGAFGVATTAKPDNPT
jgi:hypothetical protein